MSSFAVVADRLCQVRKAGSGLTDGPPLDENGFLSAYAPVITSIHYAEDGVLADPAMLAEAGAFLLLGEPGIGKSTTLEQIGQRAGEVVSVDGADITSESFRDLVESPIEAFLGDLEMNASGGPGAITIIIDQVDECPIATGLGRRLDRMLQRTGTAHVRLLIACRTADVPASLVDAIQKSFGDCQVADLVPLSYSEAERLAASDSSIDGTRMIVRAVAAGAGLLASVPLTLGFLADGFRRTGDVVGSIADLFANGTTWSLDEPDPDRRRVLVSSLSQRKAIAGRIAALLLLSGRRTVWVGSALGAGGQDLELGLAADGSENAGQQPFEITAAAVRETRSTAVFTGRGENRIAFRHGSIAAYLNASLLVDRGMPVSQLKSLFFVPVGTDRYAIPSALQESAAWLIHLCPSHGEWIATADPESLMSYSKIVDSANVRKAIVTALLAKAGEVELADRPWSRRTPDLNHPELSSQLRQALEEAGQYGGSWDDLARVRLAVQLARAASLRGLRAEMLTLLSDTTWPAHVRQLAALAAFEAEPYEVGGSLRQYILRFEDAALAAEIDPDQEILGSVLKALWPTHLDVGEVLRLLHPKRRRDLFGVYRGFLASFPASLNDADLTIVLAWADQKRTRLRRPKRVDTEVIELGEDPLGEIDIEMVEPLVDRYFEISSNTADMAAVAKLLYAQLERHDSPPLPFSLIRVDERGDEDPVSRLKRRDLALELLTIPSTFDRSDAWMIVLNWSRRETRSFPSYLHDARQWIEGDRRVLLDGTDFRWAYELCGEAVADGQVDRADRLAILAALIFPQDDRPAFELIADDRSHPVSQKLRYLYESIDIDSPIADQLRRSNRFEADRAVGPSWDGRIEFVQGLRSEFDAIVGGDSESLWKLIWRLQFDPETGRSGHGFCDDLDELPGWAAISDHSPTELLDAALDFVSVSADHGEEWLGTDNIDHRATAGYLALAALLREGRIAEVSSSSWNSWTAAIVWFWTIPMECGDRDIKAQLLSIAAREAPESLKNSLLSYVRGELNRGQSPSEVEVVAEVADSSLRDAMTQLLVEVVDAIYAWEGPEEETSEKGDDLATSPNTPPPGRKRAIELQRTDQALDAAKRTFETILEAQLSVAPEATSLVETIVENAAPEESTCWLAVSALSVALGVDAELWWPRVKAWIHEATHLSRPLCITCGRSHDWKPFILDLEASAVAEVFGWIKNEFPPQADVNPVGAHMVGPEEQAQHWRRAVLSHLAGRGSREALEALEDLEREFPDDLYIAAATVNARASVAEVAWRRPSSSDVLALLSSTRRRLVRTDAELANVLVEVLRDIETDLPGHCELLWDVVTSADGASGQRPTLWRPKPEAALCAYLTHELRLRLGLLDVFVNREVMVKPTDRFGAGERTDILVQATTSRVDARDLAGASATVVIEVKGAWNRSLGASQRTQLADRYLHDVGSTSGIYLVGWFPLEQWNDLTDSRRRSAPKGDIEEIRSVLLRQSDEIRADLGVRTTPVVLDIPRPAPATERS